MTLTRDRLSDSQLFDETPGYEDDTGVKVAAGLTEQERRQAVAFYRLFNELWGVCVVKGNPGTGKDTFGNYLSYTLKRFFPQKKVLRDEKPRKLYGEYAGLFNEQVIQDDLKKMREVAKGARKESNGERYDGNYMDALEKAADRWVTEKGEVMLQDSVLYLTELWRYCYNREPHNPMNKTMGGIFKVKRHLNLFTIGTIQLVEELDKKTCKPWIDWQVTCTRSKADSTRYTYFVERVKYDKRLDILVPLGRPFAIPLDAGKPRSFIGDGKIRVLKPDYHPETDEEELVLGYLKAGVEDYDELVDALEMDGDMSEYETLSTLKQLALKLPDRRPKFAVAYPCFYRIFNSKSAPQMRSKVRVEVD